MLQLTISQLPLQNIARIAVIYCFYRTATAVKQELNCKGKEAIQNFQIYSIVHVQRQEFIKEILFNKYTCELNPHSTLGKANIILPVANLGFAGFVCQTVKVYEQEHLIEQTALPNTMRPIYEIR